MLYQTNPNKGWSKDIIYLAGKKVAQVTTGTPNSPMTTYLYGVWIDVPKFVESPRLLETILEPNIVYDKYSKSPMRHPTVMLPLKDDPKLHIIDEMKG